MPHEKGCRASKQGNKKHGSPSKPTSSKPHSAKKQHIEEPLVEHADHQAKEHAHEEVNLKGHIVVGKSFEPRAIYDTQFYKWSEQSVNFGTTGNTASSDAPQLQLWAYETSNTTITIAERLEKANWETEKLERL